MIWISQWLCPKRHCLVGLGWDDEVDTQDAMRDQGEKLFEDTVFNRWCGICGSRDIQVEHGQTKFRDMEEAEAAIRVVEASNAVARRLLGGRF